MTDMLKWYSLCPVDEIPQRGGRRIYADDMQIAVFRTSDDQVYAIEDKCPHLGGRLSEGIVHDHCVTCPLHNLVIDLQTGKARSVDPQSVMTFPVKVVDGMVHFSLTPSLETTF